MDRQSFISAFVVSWLAARSASLYQEQCNNGIHWEGEDVPIEVAESIAETAWRAYRKHAKLKRESRRPDHDYW